LPRPPGTLDALALSNLLPMLGLARYAPGGRLTGTSLTPVTAGDLASITTLYYTPYAHDCIVLWDGTRWVTLRFAEASLALGTVVTGAAYDVWGYVDATGVLALEKSLWASGTVFLSR
jgi:hypothetical protein